MIDGRDIDELRRLVEESDLEGLSVVLQRLWGNAAPDDLGILSRLLLKARAVFGDAASILYSSVSGALKAVREDNQSLVASLRERRQVIAAYEGKEAGRAFLRAQAEGLSGPSRGFPQLLLGTEAMAQGRFEDARPLLRSAVWNSMSGVRWYLVPSLRAMARCLVHQGEVALAFEYVRAVLITSYETGDITEEQMRIGLQNFALTFGILDYLVEMQLNAAAQYRTQGRVELSISALQTAAATYAELGDEDRASESFDRARSSAEAVPGRMGEALVWACRLLAALERPFDRASTLTLLTELAAWAPARPASSLLRAPCETGSDARAWRAVLNGLPLDDDGKGEWQRRALLAAVMHVANLVPETDRIELYELVVGGDGMHWLGNVARRSLVMAHRAAGDLEGAERICEEWLSGPDSATSPSTQFHFATELARCRAEQGRSAEALAAADEAAVSWRRVLLGLSTRRSKLVWLQQGARCLDVTVEVLMRDDCGLEEDERLRRLFSTMELAKARLVGDAINRKDYVASPFLVADIGGPDAKSDLFFSLVEEAPDWYVPISLLLPHASGIPVINSDYGEGPNPISTRLVDSMPVTAALPLAGERQLLEGTASVTYDGPERFIDTALIKAYERSGL